MDRVWLEQVSGRASSSSMRIWIMAVFFPSSGSSSCLSQSSSIYCTKPPLPGRQKQKIGEFVWWTPTSMPLMGNPLREASPLKIMGKLSGKQWSHQPRHLRWWLSYISLETIENAIKVVVVAHSYGGIVAMHLASTFGEDWVSWCHS